MSHGIAAAIATVIGRTTRSGGRDGATSAPTGPVVSTPDGAQPADARTPPPDCRPPIADIFDYWRHISPVDGLPGRQHLDPMAITWLLPNLWLLDVLPTPDASLGRLFRYRLVGTEMVRVFGHDPTGRLFHEVWPRMVGPAGVYDHHVGVVEQKRPSYRHGPTLYDGTRDHKWVERLLLPLARDGSTVDMILGLTLYGAAPRNAG